jgi:hypothetical protein
MGFKGYGKRWEKVGKGARWKKGKRARLNYET